jgi:hypothetical protein
VTKSYATIRFKKVSPQDLAFPIMLKVMTDEEKKEYHLKKLLELSKRERAKLEYRVDGSIWKDGKPIAEEPNENQSEWLNLRLSRNTFPKVRENKIGDYKNWR